MRVVLADAIERFGGGLVQSRLFLEPDEVQKVVAIFLGEAAPEPEAEPTREIRDKFSFLDLPPEDQPKSTTEIIMDRSEPALFRRIPFNRRQWIVLVVMIVLNVILLIALVLIFIVAQTYLS